MRNLGSPLFQAFFGTLLSGKALPYCIKDGKNIDPACYAAEPFVLPADVYAAPRHEGEAGWTWYTGSAGWYFRVVTEELLGLRLRGGKLTAEPRIPDFTARWTGDGKTRTISVKNGKASIT